MPSKIGERKLLYQIQVEQNSDAYGLLYDAYVNQIYRFVFFKVKSREEAEDITSEVFLKAWNYLRDNKEIASFSGLLYRIARNCVVDSYRGRAARPEVPLNDDMDVADSGAWLSNMSDKLESAAVIKALGKLKHEYREILTLRFVDELNITEIAEIMGKGHIAVRVTLHRAAKKLKDIIEQARPAGV